MNTIQTYRDRSGLARLLKFLLGLGAAVAAVSLLSSFMQIELLSRSYSESEGQANDLREQIIGVLQLVLYLCTAVVFGRWIYRANQNVRALGADDLPITPGWAVGYFFVPVVNLWRPYQAMKDLWKASHNPTYWQTIILEPAILPVWWGLWILSNVLGRASSRAMSGANTVENFRYATYLQTAAEAVSISLCLVALSVVTQIHRAQSRAVALGAPQPLVAIPGAGEHRPPADT